MAKQANKCQRWRDFSPERPSLPPIDELNVETYACSRAREQRPRSARPECLAGHAEGKFGMHVIQHVASSFKDRLAPRSSWIEPWLTSAVAFFQSPLQTMGVRQRVAHVPVSVCISVDEEPDCTNSMAAFAAVEKDSNQNMCLVLRDKSSVLATLTLYDLEVLDLAGRMVALVPLLQGPAKLSMDDVGFLAFEDDARMDEFWTLLAAGGIERPV